MPLARTLELESNAPSEKAARFPARRPRIVFGFRVRPFGRAPGVRYDYRRGGRLARGGEAARSPQPANVQIG